MKNKALIRPFIPIKPVEPHEYFDIHVELKIAPSIDHKLLDILNNLPKDVSVDDLHFMVNEGYCDEADISFYYISKKVNDNYNSQMKSYEKKMKEYEVALTKYNSLLDIYNKNMETIKKYAEELELKSLKKRIKELEKKRKHENEKTSS